ncbi:TolC family protein [Candidatus Marinarcus aquaticus]|uniref:TolC family protein n=1 Tax=Candidatus Marinarcus aquaticus TaxID=2044504 RepID=A0A4Q0XSZ1_9BACT|nr:TolC family protein [Candidatus Marinarcus aquaticus]RXJ60600.1 hypothetical protein CRV04_00905 [Candidatus Marinarcus aquaticus]
MLKQTVYASMIALSMHAYAIDLKQSIDIALNQNYDIKEQQYVKEEKNANNNAAFAPFLPSVDLAYSFERRDETIVNQSKEDSVGSATVSYNLFNGFSDIFSLLSSNYVYKSSKYTYEATKQDIILQTKQAYITVLKQQKNLVTKEDALKLFNKQYEDARNKFDQGLIARNDLLEVEVQMLQAKQEVIRAKKELKVARLSLNNILSNALKTDEKLEELQYEELQYNTTKEDFINKRSEVAALKMLMDSYNAQENSDAGAFLPSIDASFGYYEYGDDRHIDGKEGYPENQEIAKVTASWNLFSGGKDINTVIATHKKKKQVYAQLEKLKLQIQLQYEQALEELEVAKLNYETAQVALEQAKINYDIVNNRFEQGVSKSSDLIDANFLLSQAKQNFYSAYYDKFLAVATLQRVMEND